MIGVALGAISSPEDTKVLSLLAIAQRLEARWPGSEGQRFDSRKSWSAKPWTENRTVPTSCRPTTTTYVANRSGPLSLCTTVQTLRELWPIWHFRGPCLHRPTLWKAFLCPECSLYTIAHQLAKVWALLYMLGVALGAMSPSGNTKVLSLLAIAQRLEARWPDSEGQGFDSQKSWSAKPLNGKQTWPTSCRPTNTTYVASHFDPLLLCTTIIH